MREVQSKLTLAIILIAEPNCSQKKNIFPEKGNDVKQ